MHFSKSTVIAAAAFFASVSAAPTPDTAPVKRGTARISPVVNHLDSAGKIEWQSTEDGGRYATIGSDDIDAARKATTKRSLVDLEARGGTDAAVGAFTNIGNIAQQAASYACESSGEWGVSATIESQATAACANFLQNLPGVPQAETVWSVYQGIKAPDSSGGNFITNFRWFYNTAAAPPLTTQICAQAYQALTSDFCQGKGSNDANTQGGEVKIGKGDDFLMIGLDPNSS
ncbi:hypothetical protein OEA41_009890 [Lepraria neglecta]|uniref:Uncharacterized protein n=1 Tax=Lepraria neglecta TaxID=209136 RepID=A0AAE0DF24_9LECA|nr:hypothetical protein OEA41_009890 [Lepraria neglecta]